MEEREEEGMKFVFDVLAPVTRAKKATHQAACNKYINIKFIAMDA
jgi:hypothetical protein